MPNPSLIVCSPPPIAAVIKLCTAIFPFSSLSISVPKFQMSTVVGSPIKVQTIFTRFRPRQPPTGKPLSFDYIEQFVPTRALPSPHLNPIHRRQILNSLATLIKTSGDNSTLLSFSVQFCPLQLSHLLASFPDHNVALAFFNFLLRDSTARTIRLCCVAALNLAGIDSWNPKKPLAQGVLICIAGKPLPFHGTQLVQIMLVQNYSNYRCLPDHVILNLVFRSFLNNGIPIAAMGILHIYRTFNLFPQITAMSILLKLLFKHGYQNHARKVFAGMFQRGPLPTTLTFTTMIIGFCLTRSPVMGESLLWLMPRYHLQPDSCSYNVIIKSYFKAGQAKEGFNLFKYMDSLPECAPNIVTYNIAMDFFCRQGRMEEARRVFDEIREVGLSYNTITYNVLLNGYVKAGRIDEAFSVYSKLMTDNDNFSCDGHIKNWPDCYTYNILVAGYHKFGKEHEVGMLLNDVLRLEIFSGNSSEFEVIISRLCWDGKLDEARIVLAQIVDDGEIPSVLAFNAVIAGYSRIGYMEEAGEVYCVMRKAGVTPLPSTFSYLLLGLCRYGRMKEAEHLFGKMVESGVSPDKSVFSTLIDGFFRIGDVSSAIHIWKEMSSTYKIAPDVVIFSAVINGLCSNNNSVSDSDSDYFMEEAVAVFNEMLSKGFVPNNFVYNSLIRGFARIRNFDKVKKCEDMMKSRGLAPNAFTNNILINGFCKAGRIEQAASIFRSMSTKQPPDIVTYNTFISTYIKSFDMDSAITFVNLLLVSGHGSATPDITTYNIWIHSLCVSHVMSRAMRIVEDLIPLGIVPDIFTYNIILNGICIDGISGRALIVAAKLIKMTVFFVPSIVTVNILFSHFYKNGMSRRALMWAQKLKEAGFCFDSISLRILDKAYIDVVGGIYSQSEEWGGGGGCDQMLLLDFFMQVIFDRIVGGTVQLQWWLDYLR